MNLDVNTLLFCSLASRIGFLAIFAAFGGRWMREVFFWRWCLSFGLISLSIGAVIVGGGRFNLSPAAGFVVLNLIAAGAVAYWSGTRHFYRLASWRATELVLAILPGSAYAAIVGLTGNVAMGYAAMLLLLSVTLALTSYTMVRLASEVQSLPQWVVGIVSMVMTLAVLIAAGLISLSGGLGSQSTALMAISVDTAMRLALIGDQLATMILYVGAMAIVADRSASRLEYLMETDLLTGISNRRGLSTHARRLLALASRNGQEVSIMLLEVDSFRQIDERYGHDAADGVLKEFVERMQRVVRRGCDLIGRLGGEEFVVVVPGTDIAHATGLAERLRRTIERENFTIEGSSAHVTVSIGVAALERSAQTMERAILKARHALHAAKQAGRNRVMAFQSKPLIPRTDAPQPDAIGNPVPSGRA